MIYEKMDYFTKYTSILHKIWLGKPNKTQDGIQEVPKYPY
jgi:hypothetical protein